MDKNKRQKRFEQKYRNLNKWMDRIKARIRREGRSSMTEEDEKRAHMYANHGELCSCHMCGNPRKYFREKTIQEQRADEKFKELDEE